MSTISLRELTKSFGGSNAVDSIDLDILEGELVVLVGPSGCGKSTTLRMVAGLEDVSSGEVRLDDVVINDLPPRDRDMAMVFQSYALYPHMTVADNLSYALRLRRMDRGDIQRRVRETASMLGIEEMLDRKPAQLSGGQRQRVALGRAIIRQPKVFLMDEPLSNLDASLRVQTRAEIARLQGDLGVTTVYVTHDQTEAMTMGSKIVVMNAGRIEQVDDPMRVYDAPATEFVARFIGDPPMNLMPCRIKRSGGKTFLEQGTGFRLALPPGVSNLLPGTPGASEVVFGVRPEDLRLETRGRKDGDDANINSPVEVIEPLGYGTLVYLALQGREGKRFIARVPTEEGLRIAPDTSVSFAVNWEKVRFFDPRTGRALGLSNGPTAKSPQEPSEVQS